MRPTKYFLVAGARPNFTKISPILRAFSAKRNGYGNADVLLVHTGPHYSRNMSDEFFRDLDIPEPKTWRWVPARKPSRRGTS